MFVCNFSEMKRFLIILLTLSGSMLALGAMSTSAIDNSVKNDSLKIYSDSVGTPILLNEVSATPSNVVILSDGIAYRPSRQNKRTAMNPLVMLQRMGISNLNIVMPPLGVKASDVKVSDYLGNNAKFYIDGSSATDIDINNLLPNDIAEVRILNSPGDPKYRSEPLVIDFITRKWSYGGYILTNGYQRILQKWGDYSLGAKVVKGKSTFQFLGGFGYYRFKDSESESYEHYLLPRGNGLPELELDRYTKTLDIVWNKNYPSAGLQWDYHPSDKINMTLNFGYETQDNPQFNSYKGYYIDNNNDLTKQDFYNHSANKYDTYNIGYDLYAKLNNNTSFSFIAGLTYTTTDNRQEYFSGETEIYNRVKEHSYSPALTAEIDRALGHNNSLSLKIDVKESFFNLDYSGTADQNFSSRQSRYALEANYSHTIKVFGKNLRLRLTGELPYNIIGRESEPDLCSLDYDIWLFASIMTSNKSYFSGQFNIGQDPRMISYINRVNQQQTDITGIKGNRNLKPGSHSTLSLSYTWLPTSALSLTAWAGRYTNHFSVTEYSAQNNLIYTSQINSGTDYMDSGGLSGSLKLLGGNISIQSSIKIMNQHHTGYLYFNFWNVVSSLSVNYMNNHGFSASVGYSTPSGKSFVQNTSKITKNSNHSLNFSAGYQTGNLMVNLNVSPLYKRLHTMSYVDVEGVDIRTDNYSRLYGRSISVSARYIIDCGRRYPHGNDMFINKRTSSSL